MKIISKFKDYYDHLLGKYGIDEKVVFNRTKIIPNVNHELSFDFRPRGFSSDPRENYSYRILSICGKYFTLVAKGALGITKVSSFRLVIEKDLDNPKIVEHLRWLLPISRNSGWFTRKDKFATLLKDNLSGVYDETLVELSKKIDMPVFVIISCTRDSVTLDPYSPNLSKIKGISSVYPSEKIFNDVSFFIGNVLNNSEDKTHLIVSDKDKIVKGGFDLKTSFRGKV